MSTTTTSWVLELIDKISKPLRDIERAGSGVNAIVDDINGRLKVLKTQTADVSGRLKNLALGAAAFGVLAAGSIQFEEGMARANTMAGLSNEAFARVENQIRDIAEVVPIAKKQLAEGLFETIRARVPKDNWISFLENSSKAAIAGNAELGVVVDSTTSTIRAYGLAWDQANAVQDRFQDTVRLGQIPSLQALTDALPRVTGVSAKLQVSQEELLSVFATASSVMVQPAEVATQLNAVLSALLKPSAEATKAAEKLGIAFNASSVARSGGLQNFIKQLIPQIEDLSKRTGQNQEEIIGQLFGSQEAIKLIIGLGGELAEGWASNTESLKNSAGAVKTAFDIMSETTSTKLQLMRNSFGNVMDSIVNVLSPFIDMLLDGASKVFGFVSAFTEANPTLSQFIIVGGGAAFVLTTVLTAVTLVSLRLETMKLKLLAAAASNNVFTAAVSRGTLFLWNMVAAGASQVALLAGQATGYALTGAFLVGSFLTGLVTATAAQWGLNIAMNANPIGLIVLGLAAIIGVIVLVIKYWDEIKNAITKFTVWIVEHSPFAFLIDLIDRVFPGFKQKIAEVFNFVKDLALAVWERVKKIWADIKAFFGFGSDDSVDVEVGVTQKGKVEGASPNSDLDLSSAATQPDANATNTFVTPTGGNGKGNIVTGTVGGSGKTINMTLNITNSFNMAAGKWREQVDEIANQVVGRINDRLRDSVIALE